MTKTVWTRLLVLLLVYIAGNCGIVWSMTAQRPNILLIMVDDKCESRRCETQICLNMSVFLAVE